MFLIRWKLLMQTSHALIVKKSVSTLNTSINLDFKEAFSSFGKMLIAGFSGNGSTAAEFGVDGLKAIGSYNDPAKLSWFLITNSFLKAFGYLIEEYQDLLTADFDDTRLVELAQRLEHQINVIEVSIDLSFFDRPQDLSLFDDFEPALTLWLKSFGMDNYQATAFQGRLKGTFVLALNELWRGDYEKYQCIVDQLDTPVTKAALDEAAWINYSLWLQEQANTRVFDEAFGLREIYIPLRAYYKEKGDDLSDETKITCDLHTYIHEWIQRFDKNNTLKVVSGGPGSGKSSFAKVLAAEVAERKEIPVLFIALHHFNMTDDFVESVGNFVRDNRHLTTNPILQETRKERLLLIFDGLDELSMQGQAATDSANQFVDKLIKVLDRQNDAGNKWQAIITGRDLSVQSNEHSLDKQQQVLSILPYRLNDEEKTEYQDEDQLLGIDQRSEWWQKFGKAKGHQYDSLPEILDTDNLHPITREPLLNYLLSLSYERGGIEFDNNTSLNSIYFDLLQAVYERNYADNKHEASRHLKFEEFLNVLEEIALAVWHGNGRTASESYLLERCEEGGLKPHLDKFSEGAKKGVVRLLTAFYFRQFGKDKTGDRTFEFTHKSFGEYLTARRIVAVVDSISEELGRNKINSRVGWNHAIALEEWIKITGPSEFDPYLLGFIKNEMVLKGEESARKWQKTFAELLGVVVRSGAPVEKIGLPSFDAMLKHSSNAEGALLSIHYACSRITKDILEVDWDNRFEAWLLRVKSQLFDHSLMGQLSNLDLSNNAFRSSNFAGAELSNSLLENTHFVFIPLWGAQLKSSKLSHCRFFYVNARGCNFEGADFKKSLIYESSMLNVNLKNSDLRGASLSDSDLGLAELDGADLTNSMLRRVSFEAASLTKVNLDGAKLENVDFKNADLTCADFRYANLKSVNFEGATLDNTNFEGAKLQNTVVEPR